MELLRDAPACPPYWATSTYTRPRDGSDSFWANLAVPLTRHVNEVCARIDDQAVVVDPRPVRVRSLEHCPDCLDADLAPWAEVTSAHFLAEATAKVAALESKLSRALVAWDKVCADDPGAQVNAVTDALADVVYWISLHPALDSWHADGLTMLRDQVDNCAQWATKCRMGAGADVVAGWLTGRAQELEEQLAAQVAAWHDALARHAASVRSDEVVVAELDRHDSSASSHFSFLATGTAEVLAVGERTMLLRMPQLLARRAGLDYVAAVGELAHAPSVCARTGAVSGAGAAGPLCAVVGRLLDDGYELGEALDVALAAVS